MIGKLIERMVARRHPKESKSTIEAEVRSRHDEVGRGVAQRFTRGNVNIKRGAFLTREDLDARKAR